ncbi:MAG: hypothetical protein R6U39_00285 [Candidatus Aegiribacteria sp.]
MVIMFALAVILAGSSGDKPAEPEYLPVPLETPPFQYTLNREALEFLTLELMECEENGITDYGEWFDYIIGWPAITYHNGGSNDAIRGSYPPDMVPPVLPVPGGYRFHLYMVIYGNEKTLAFYGSEPNRYDVILDPRVLMVMDFYTFEPELILDFQTYSHSPEDREEESDFLFQQLRWADVQQGVLYVSTAHRTYSASSGGLNAYITAIDLNTLEILWRSRPLVAGSENFLIEGDTIISGYGFTGEDDYVYLLNRLTGEVMESRSVPSAPEYFYRDEDRLYVRCYGHDCVFEVLPARR